MWSPALFVATLAASVSVSAAADAPRVNGWYPCAFSTETNEAEYGSSFDDMTVFECAEIELPLCYEGVCKSDRKIDVFVKRLLAENSDGGARKALVLVEGGPGFAATGMEDKMVSLVQKMIGAVDFYTFDHRGTGRSEFLECDAAQALTKGSPDGKQLSMEELQACLQDLNFKYDDQAAAFSTTSAAMDVRAMIETFMADQEVYVAGYSYGTYLTQRLMQLQPPQVVGYVFDGVDVLSGKNDTLQSANSHWNEAIIVPGQRVLEHCYDDDKCGIKFKSRETVLEDTIAFFDELDANTTNPCAKVLVETGDYEQPSVNLRNMLGQMVTDYDTRAIALKVIAKVQRCSVSDVSWLSTFFGGDSGDDEEDTDEVAIVDSLNDVSSLLYNVIVFSERWSQPGPTQEERDENFMGGVFSTDDSETALQYCVFTGADDKACQELKDKIPSKINQTFFYPRDKYVDGILALPDHASALIINGGLDLQTPQEFGELLYEKISGTGKGAVMVNFEYGIHCAGEAVAGSDGSPCRDSITASFIENSGDLESINTNCMSSLPRATFGWDDSEKKKMKLLKKKKH